MIRKLGDRLQLPLDLTNTSVLGIEQGLLNIKYFVNAKIKSRFNNRLFKTSFMVTENISNKVPCSSLDRKLLNISKDVVLADSNFSRSGKVDLLLGSGSFWDSIEGEQRKLGSGQPILQKSQLGCIIAGPYGVTGKETKTGK